MKEFLKKLIPYGFFTAVWFWYDIDYTVYGESALKSVVFVAAFAVTMICFFAVKNQRISLPVISVISLAVAIYDIDYLFFFVPVFIVIYMYFLEKDNKETGKNKKSAGNSGFDALMVLSINFSVAIIIYGLVKLFNYPENHVYTMGFTIGVHSSVLTIVLVALLVCGLRNKTANKSKNSNNKAVNNLNIMCVVIYAVQQFAYYSGAHHNGGFFGIMFFPWFVYIMIVVYNNDPNYIAFINAIEGKIESLVNSKREVK